MNRRTRIYILAALLLGWAVTTASACLWDYDTLQMERMRFPGVLEIITGKFVRHSKAYYRWRIEDRTKKLAAMPDDPALIDDLAVAYAKLGQPEKGIPLLEASLARHPNRYETLSNLGTLLFFAGRLDESKDYLRRALKINPDAHFGREKYQLLLTEYVQQSELKSKGVMCSEIRNPHRYGPVGFAEYVEVQCFGKEDSSGPALTKVEISARKAERSRAEKGVLGMMHFADFESPILLEALGDLLMAGEADENRTQLAARAYLRAAQESPDAAEKAYRDMAKDALSNLEEFDRDNLVGEQLVEKMLSKELATGRDFFAKIEADELRWIEQGRDVDREFAAVYYGSLDDTIAAAEKKLRSEPKEVRFSQREQMNVVFGISALVVLILLAAIAFLIFAFIRWILSMDPAKPMSESAPRGKHVE